MPSPVPLDDTLGALSVSVIICTFLFGITTLQVYLYIQWYSEDSCWTKSSVALLWVLDGLPLALLCQVLYSALITNFGDVHALTSISWSMRLQMLLNAYVPALLQILYTIRLWRICLDRRWTYILVPILLSLTTIGDLVIATVNISSIYRFRSVASVNGIERLGSGGLILVAVTDCGIALAIGYFLYEPRRSFVLTPSFIQNVVLWMFGTGLFTGLGSITTLVLFVKMPDNLVFYAVNLAINKLYINSYLAMLNGRRYLRSQIYNQPLLLRAIPTSDMDDRPFGQAYTIEMGARKEPPTLR